MPARNCIDLIPGRMRWLLAALLPFAAACGEDVTPVAPTTPVPEPRVCTDELERARAYIDSILPREWDGTPFRFDLFDHFPEIAGADYLDGQLEEVRGLAERIEEQIGYPIIEAGSVIPVRANLPQGWNGPPPIDLGTCDQWRETGSGPRHPPDRPSVWASGPGPHVGGAGMRARGLLGGRRASVDRVSPAVRTDGHRA